MHLLFAASDGYLNSDPRGREGVGGTQLWRVTGGSQAVGRAFQRSGNDLYLDEAALDDAFPARFGVLGSAVYVSGNIGDLDRAVPRGGLKGSKGSNSLLEEGFDQAAAVWDADTPPDGNMTAILTVDRGLLCLRDGDNLAVVEGRPGYRPLVEVVSFLLVEARPTDSSLLMNALQAMGHRVTVVNSGEAGLCVCRTLDSFCSSDMEQSILTYNRLFFITNSSCCDSDSSSCRQGDAEGPCSRRYSASQR